MAERFAFLNCLLDGEQFKSLVQQLLLFKAPPAKRKDPAAPAYLHHLVMIKQAATDKMNLDILIRKKKETEEPEEA